MPVRCVAGVLDGNVGERVKNRFPGAVFCDTFQVR